MTTPVPTPDAARPRRGAVRLVLVLAALSWVLSACAGPAAEPTEQETVVQSLPDSPEIPESSGTSRAPESPGTPGAPAVPVPPATSTPGDGPTPTAPPAASGATALLTISIQQDPAGEPAQYVLECIDGVPGPASTLPGADAACAALARLGTEFFTARPAKDIICTQQYGGPQTASITGDLNGTSILASFALTDGCEISRWDRVRDILGAPGAQ